MTRKMVFTLCFFIFVTTISCGLFFIEPASAQSSENYIISAKSNNAWILDKKSRKLMFIQYKEKDEIWKSEQVTVPFNFNLDHCFMETVGSTGNYVFVCDQSSGLITFYQVNKDRSILQYVTVDLQAEFK